MGGEDISVVNVTVRDDNGREVPDASGLIQFKIEGNGRIIGIGNGDPSSHEADKCMDGNWKRRLFNGKCQVIVQSSEQKGRIMLSAVSEGLQSARVIISTND